MFPLGSDICFLMAALFWTVVGLEEDGSSLEEVSPWMRDLKFYNMIPRPIYSQHHNYRHTV